MSRGKDLIKNTGILFIAKTSTQLVSFFMLPLYTALLSTAEYGRLDIYSSLVMILLPIITMQIEQAVFRFLIGQSDYNSISNVVSSAFVALAITVSSAIVLYVAGALIFKFEYPVQLFFYYASMMLSTILYQVCRGFGKNGVYGFATFLISFVTVSLNVVFVAIFKMGVQGVLTSTAIAHIFGSIYMIVSTKVYKYISFGEINKNSIIEMLGYSVPLIFNQISSWAINYSDRLIILACLGIGINGIYSVANKFSNILNTFFNVFNLAWTENVVRNIDDPDVSVYTKKIVTLTIQIYFSLIIVIINLLPIAFKLLVNETYFDAYYHIPILLTAAAFSGISASLGSIYVAFKKTKNVGITTMMAGVVNVVSHLAMVNFIGLYAASISTLISFVALFIYRYVNIQSFFKINIEYKRLISILAILLIAWVGYLTGNNNVIVIGLALNLTNIALLAKENLVELKTLLKK